MHFEFYRQFYSDFMRSCPLKPAFGKYQIPWSNLKYAVAQCPGMTENKHSNTHKLSHLIIIFDKKKSSQTHTYINDFNTHNTTFTTTIAYTVTHHQIIINKRINVLLQINACDLYVVLFSVIYHSTLITMQSSTITKPITIIIRHQQSTRRVRICMGSGVMTQ